MANHREKTNVSFITAIIIHIYIGWGFLFLLKAAVGKLTHNAYMGLFPAILFIIPFLWFSFDLARVYPSQSITQITNRVFGQIAGKLVGIILLSYLIFFEVISLRVGQLMVYSYFFNRTPFFLITTVIILGGLYQALKGFKSIGRLASFMLIPPLAVIFLLEILGLFNVNPLNLRPIFIGTPTEWCLSGMDLTLILLPGTAIFFYMQFLTHPQNVKKICLRSLYVVIPVLLLGVIGTVGTLGPPLTQQMSWSIVEFFHTIDYPYLLLEQAGLFFLIAWYAITYVAISQGLFIIGNELNILFPKIKRQWLIIAVTALALGMVNIPLNIIFLEDFIRRYRIGLSFSYLGIILITWLVARIRAKSKPSNLK